MKHYDSYKHYVLSGNPDNMESYKRYYTAIGENNAKECGMTFTVNMRRWYEYIAERNYNMRYTLPIGATL